MRPLLARLRAINGSAKGHSLERASACRVPCRDAGAAHSRGTVRQWVDPCQATRIRMKTSDTDSHERSRAQRLSQRTKSGGHRLALTALALCALEALSSPRIEAAENANEEQARAHYQQGVAYSERGELDLALQAFERAYSAVPRPAVLFNIGQLQYSLGKLVAAKETLERYLREVGAKTTSETIVQASRTLEQCYRRLGKLTLNLKPANARVYLDGVPLEGTPVAMTVPVGAHAIVAMHDGYQPALSTFEVGGGKLTTIELALTPSGTPSGWLKVDCLVPDVTAYLGNVPMAASDWKQPVPLRERSTTIKFARVGYATVQREIVATTGHVVSVSCDLRPLARLTATQQGNLVLRTFPSNSEVLVDGTPFRASAVPIGRHRIEVRHPGYFTQVHDVNVGSPQELLLDVKLKATPEFQRKLEVQAQHQRSFSYALGSAGVALNAVALTAYLINRSRYDTWQGDRDRIAAGASNPREWADLAERAASIQRVDDYALVGGVVGTALLTTSIYFLIKGEESLSW